MDTVQNVMADANLFARYVAGLRGDELVAGAVNPNGEQTEVDKIEDHLFFYCAGMCGASAAALTSEPEPEPTIVDQQVQSSGDQSDGPVSSDDFSLSSSQAVITEVVRVSQDSTIAEEHPHRNFGKHPLLRVGGSKLHHAVLEFPLPEIDRGTLTSAQLVLTPYKKSKKQLGRDMANPPLQLVLLPTSFVEGNGGGGKKMRRRAKGPGVTWSCANNSKIQNGRRDCSASWDGGQANLPVELATIPIVFISDTQQYHAEVLSLIKQAVEDGQTNLALLMMPTTAQGVWLYAKESGGDADVANSHVPQLILQWQE
jgi:hypothetical protein